MAACFIKDGNFSRAKEVLSVCLKLDPNNAKAHFRMAKVYTELKGEDRMEGGVSSWRDGAAHSCDSRQTPTSSKSI
jgi:hypothetical protein